ncbi:MAG: helix-turn-helix transcriptional regulator [Chloroflexi bacterium]|nr:helix-turn-helix transcriptional regulator [Chloroflexota bacterium]
MEELFHKPAKKEWQSQLRRSGVLSARSFSECSDIRAFSPSKELASRISHYWILRWNIPEGMTYKPTEVLGAPVVNIFFTRSGGFLYGLSPKTIEYDARHNEVIAGITFLPGGFHPYWKKPMHTLPKGKIQLRDIIPDATPEFCQHLLAIPEDSLLASELDKFFLGIQAQDSLHGQTIQSIFEKINSDPNLRSVASVSDAFRIPERTLQHIFREEVGTSVKWVILRARLLEAVMESFGEDEPDWARIAYQYDYSSQAHFITDFKRVFGVSPQRYRKMNWDDFNQQKQ